MVRKIAAYIWRQTAPRSYWESRLDRLRTHTHEPELSLLPVLVDAPGTAVDIGAAAGTYIAHLVDRASGVLAFEPRPQQAAELREFCQVLQLPVRLEAVALSDRAGSATLRILTEDMGRSTIDAANALQDSDGSPRTAVQVPTRRLDDYMLTDVVFMKIDVEGHELAVLRGAAETIDRTRCNLLVEIEDRHHAGATEAVIQWMSARCYEGYFLLDGRLRQISDFALTRHQNAANIGGWKSGWARTGVYVNNFIFVPTERTSCFLRGCAELGLRQAD